MKEIGNMIAGMILTSCCLFSATSPGASGETTIEWDSEKSFYRFETESLVGTFTPHTHYNAVTELRHKVHEMEKLNDHRCIFNCEYFRDLKTPQRGNSYKEMCYPRKMAESGLVTHRKEGNRIFLFYPASEMPEDLRFDLTLTYAFEGETIDMKIEVVPKMDIPGFEMFFASYLLDFLGKTAIPRKDGAGRTQWDVFDKHESIAEAENSVFFYARDSAAGRLFQTEVLWPNIGPGWKETFYALPIIATLRDDGFTLTQMIEREVCLGVGGQHHPEDTARDFSVGGDLKEGVPLVGQARVVVTRLPGEAREEHLEALEGLFSSFEEDME